MNIRHNIISFRYNINHFISKIPRMRRNKSYSINSNITHSRKEFSYSNGQLVSLELFSTDNLGKFEVRPKITFTPAHVVFQEWISFLLPLPQPSSTTEISLRPCSQTGFGKGLEEPVHCELQAPSAGPLQDQLCLGRTLADEDFPGGSEVKNLPTMWETWVRSLGWEDPVEKGMATPLQYSCLGESHR